MIEQSYQPPIEAVLKELGNLEEALQKKVVKAGLTAAAKPLKSTMKRLAPRGRTGVLQAAIGQQQISAGAGMRLDLWDRDRTNDKLEAGTHAILVGPNRKVKGKSRASVAALLEFGTNPHVIRPKRADKLAFGGGRGFAKKVRHPGIRPRRFMERTLSAEAGQVEAGFFAGISRKLDQVKL